jgi:hypothetical protein
MIKLRTEVSLPEFNKKMGYRYQTMMIGSCFAENIGNYLRELCFPIIVNPFGTLYNPASISNCLELLLEKRIFTFQDLFYHNGVYSSLLHHGRFSGPDAESTLERINYRAVEASNLLKRISHLFITFGTSWVFRDKRTGKIVSNCHKLPADTFVRYRLSVDEINEIWIPLIGQLKIINPDLQIVFTVSPIRHLMDGAHENQISKSILLVATDSLISTLGADFLSYFPSYELMLDELRDYRYYAADMTHPSELAIEIILEKFAGAILDQESKSVSSELGKIIQVLNHRPLNNSDFGYQSLIENQIDKTKQFQLKYPFVDVETVIKKLHEKIAE